MSGLAISIILVLLLLFCVSFYYAIKFAMILIKLEDALEAGLDKLDERHISISRILEIPLFYDSLEVKQVVDDIEQCREAILNIAISLSKNASSTNLEDANFEEETKD